MKDKNLCKMVRLLLGFLGSWFRSRNDLALENLALRQQLATLMQEQPHPRLANADRAFWVVLRALWSKWSNALVIVTPDTRSSAGIGRASVDTGTPSPGRAGILGDHRRTVRSVT
jgi:hypothetical protein